MRPRIMWTKTFKKRVQNPLFDNYVYVTNGKKTWIMQILEDGSLVSDQMPTEPNNDPVIDLVSQIESLTDNPAAIAKILRSLARFGKKELKALGFHRFTFNIKTDIKAGYRKKIMKMAANQTILKKAPPTNIGKTLYNLSDARSRAIGGKNYNEMVLSILKKFIK